MSLTHLRTHTCMSLLGGPASPADWCLQASRLGYRAIGLADRAPLSALPDFLKAAHSAGLACVAGVELDLLVPSSDAPQVAVLFAVGKPGLASLSRLAQAAYAAWPARSETISPDDLKSCAASLVLVLPDATHTGAPSPVCAPEASGWVGSLRELFGERLYIGVTGNTPESLSYGLPPVALPSAHYLAEGGETAYKALQIARRKAGWADLSHPLDGSHLRAPAELETLFRGIPSALANTERIAEMCALASEDLRVEGVDGSRDLAALRSVAEERITSLGEDGSGREDLLERLNAELACIERQHTTPAWASLLRLAQYSRAERIPLGAAIAGADGSLLAHLLGASPLNPVGYASPPWLGARSAPALPPGVSIPESRRTELVARLLDAGITFAYAACLLHISPTSALLSALSVLGLDVSDAADLLKGAHREGWSAFADFDSTDMVGRAASLALSLKDAPVHFKPDTDTLVFLPHPEDAPLPLLGDRGGAEQRWLPWTRDALCEAGYPLLLLHGWSSLLVVDGALRMAGSYPNAGFDASSTNPHEYPELGAEALGVLKRGALAGVPYLTSKAFKAWKGDFSHASMCQLVVLSLDVASRPKAPAGVAAWDTHTADTGGVLLFFDQFASIVRDAAGISPDGAGALRLAMLNPDTDADGALRARFVAGCLTSGLDAEAAGRLYTALSSAAPGLLSRGMAHSMARTVALSVLLKSAHPAAFLASSIAVMWERGGRTACLPLIEEARNTGVTLLPPDVLLSGVEPTPGMVDDTWSIRWGLAQLPEWTSAAARRFVDTRASDTRASDNSPGPLYSSLRRWVRAAALSHGQVCSLVRSGACDALGDRSLLIDALTSSSDAEIELDPETEISLSPRERYLRLTWEETHIGAAFTPAPEMLLLRRVLADSEELRTRLITTGQIGRNFVGQSVYLLGLLHSLRIIDKPPGTRESGAGQMAVAWVEDLDGSIELLSFPPNYKRHKELWVAGKVVIITARVCLHDDENSVYLLCEHLASYSTGSEEKELNLKFKPGKRGEMVPLPTPEPRASDGGASVPSAPVPSPSSSSAPVKQAGPSQAQTVRTAPVSGEPPAYHLIVTLPVSEDDHADIDRMLALDSLFRAHQGPDMVTLRIPYSPETGAVTSAQLPRGVRYNSVLEGKIRALLGPDALALIKLVG